MAAAAKHVSMASFLNLTAAAERAAATDPETVKVVCAGSHRRFALDDAVCAGLIAGRLLEMGCEAEDSALAAIALAQAYEDLPAMLRISDSGRRLIAIGLEADLDFCAQVDRSDRVPTLATNGISDDERLLPV
jgi:2-phosphosulfolactate phosphatase